MGKKRRGSVDRESMYEDKNNLPPSRSARKRESAAMQKLGENLTRLKPDARKTLPLSNDLLEALAFHDQLTDREAARRQRQYIGKLMRGEDIPAIIRAVEKLESPQAQQLARFHAAETWREKLLTVPVSEIGTAIDEFLIFFGIEANPQEKEDLISILQRACNGGRVDSALKRNLFRLLLALLEKGNF